MAVQALHCKLDRDPHVSGCWDAFAAEARTHLVNMNRTDHTHPFVLQGVVQWRMIMETPREPYDYGWDDM